MARSPLPAAAHSIGEDTTAYPWKECNHPEKPVAAGKRAYRGRLGKLACQGRGFRTVGSARYRAAWAARRLRVLLCRRRCALPGSRAGLFSLFRGASTRPHVYLLHATYGESGVEEDLVASEASTARLGFALAGAPVVARHRVGPLEPRRGRSGARVANQNRRGRSSDGFAASAAPWLPAMRRCLGGWGWGRRPENPSHIGLGRPSSMMAWGAR